MNFLLLVRTGRKSYTTHEEPKTCQPENQTEKFARDQLFYGARDLQRSEIK